MVLHTLTAGPNLALFRVEGQLDYAGAPAIRWALERSADEARYARLAIDLSTVKKADEKGVAALAATVRRLRADHPAMRVIAIANDPWLVHALKDSAVNVCESGREALDYLNHTRAA